MKLHHIRNATFIIESKNKFILIDPMLSNKAELSLFSVFKHKIQKNPIVELQNNTNDLLSKVTDCLITHSQTFGIKAFQHLDHFDTRGEDFLTSKNIPITTVKKDEVYLKKYDLM
jgi:L-ascorbate metabolism protein UlaG (beta-lactamase superfamily)